MPIDLVRPVLEAIGKGTDAASPPAQPSLEAGNAELDRAPDGPLSIPAAESERTAG
jgi:hypothetical protein